VKPGETKEQYDQRIQEMLKRMTNRAPDAEMPPSVRTAPESGEGNGVRQHVTQLDAKGYTGGGVNLAQRVVLIAGFLIVLGMALFPPWLYLYRYPRLPPAERPAGYFLIFEQHAPQDRAALAALFGTPLNEADPQFFSMEIDRTRLIVQIGATLILITILYLALRSAEPAISNRTTT
jgi:hypothetical protein